MDDAAYVAAVDAHAKGNGCDDDVDALVLEVVLRLSPRAGVEAGVIHRDLEAARLEQVGDALGVFAADAIDDGRFVLVSFERFD